MDLQIWTYTKHIQVTLHMSNISYVKTSYAPSKELSKQSAIKLA